MASPQQPKDYWKSHGNELIKKGSAAEAVKAYTSGIEVEDNTHELAVLHSNRSAAYILLSDNNRAKEDAEKAVQFDPAWPKAHIRMGEVLNKVGDSKGALKHYFAAARLGATLSAGIEQFSVKTVLSCVSGLSQGCYSSLDQNDIRTHLLCSVCCGRYARPHTHTCGAIIGSCCWELKHCRNCTSPQYDSAPNYALQSCQARGCDLSQLNALLEEGASAIRDNTADSLRIFEDLCKTFPVPEVYIRRAEALLRLNYHDEALADADTGLALNPTNSYGHSVRAKILSAKESHTDALKAAITAVQLLPCDAFATQVVKCVVPSADMDCEVIMENLSKPQYHPPQLPIMDVPNQEALTESLECKLCLLLIFQPVTTPCGHTFCSVCLLRALDHTPSCPLCRTNLTGFLADYARNQRLHQTTAIDQLVRLAFPQDMTERQAVYDADLRDQETINRPIFVCFTALPGVTYHMNIFEPRYRLMMRRVLNGSKEFGMVAPGNSQDSYSNYGTFVAIKKILFLADGRSQLEVVGTRRFVVLHRDMRDGYNTAQVAYLEDDDEAESQETPEQLAQLRDKMQQLAPIMWSLTQNFGQPPQDPNAIVYWLAAAMSGGNTATLERFVESSSRRQRMAMALQLNGGPQDNCAVM